jgi:hypothetical protein
MNVSRLLLLSLAWAAAALVAGCTTSKMSRIDSNRAEYETWPIEVKQAVLDGRVEKGMTPKQVEVAVGKPTEVTSRQTRKSAQEVWVYTVGGGGSSILGNTGVAIGVGGVGVSKSSGGSGGYEEQYEVIFENGVVVSSDLPEGFKK